MASDPQTTAAGVSRFARLYSDGSFNVGCHGESEARALQELSGSQDDDDVQLVQVEIRVIRSLGAPKLAVVSATPLRGLVFIEEDGTVRAPTARDL